MQTSLIVKLLNCAERVGSVLEKVENTIFTSSTNISEAEGTSAGIGAPLKRDILIVM